MGHRTPNRIRTLLLATTLATVPVIASPGLSSSVSAQPMDTYGMGSRSISMGGAVTADVQDFSSNYYNPAGIVGGDQMRIGLSWFYNHHELQLSGLNSGVDPVHGATVGLVVPGNIGGFQFGFGLGLHLNDNRISRSRSLPRARPRWEFYDNRGQRTYLAAHIAIRPWPWLRIGGGISFLSSSDTNLNIRGSLDIPAPESRSDLEHELRASLVTIRYPQIGIQVTPMDGLSFGVVYRGEFGLDGVLTAEVDDASFTGFDSDIPGYFYLLSDSVGTFVPQQLSVGTSWSPTENLRINAELTWVNWSAYVSPIGTSEVKLEIDVPEELQELISVPDSISGTSPIAANFEDRFVPRLGIEWTSLSTESLDLDTRFGYFYENSPIPEQRGLTNLVDTDRHAFSLGLGLRLKDLRPFLPGNLELNAHFQYALLPERATRKDSAADPYGDYLASGHIFTGGLSLSVCFD